MSLPGWWDCIPLGRGGDLVGVLLGGAGCRNRAEQVPGAVRLGWGMWWNMVDNSDVMYFLVGLFICHGSSG